MFKQQILPAIPAFFFRVPELRAIFVLALVEVVWARWSGLSFSGLRGAAPLLGLLMVLWLVYGISGRSQRISNMCYIALQWILFTMVAGILTYLTAHTALPLIDADLVRIDRWLGFYWPDWFHFTQQSALLKFPLFAAYCSLPVQMLMAVFYFSDPARMGRNRELFYHALYAVIITSLLAGLFPAVGAFAYFDIEQQLAVHLPHFLLLRGGGELDFAFETMKGIVTFPSYHTVLALLYIYAYRGQGRAFYGVLALNALMLLATPGYGGHYLTDVLGGVAVTLFTIAGVRRIHGVANSPG